MPDITSDDDDQTDGEDASAHPMAHLMMTKAAATEAGKRAAEFRAAQKKKSRRIKIGMLAGFAAFSAAFVVFVGPWLVNAVNESGTGSSDEPPVEQIVDELP